MFKQKYIKIDDENICVKSGYNNKSRKIDAAVRFGKVDEISCSKIDRLAWDMHLLIKVKNLKGPVQSSHGDDFKKSKYRRIFF